RSRPRAACQAGERARCGKRRGAAVASICPRTAPRIRCATRQTDWPMKPDTPNPYSALTFPRTKRVALIGALLGCAVLMPARAGTPEAAAEFGGQCVEGLSQGRHIMTKCAVTWADKDGKTYCFSSEDARKSFLENPGANLQKARDFIAASSADSTRSEERRVG